MPSDCFSVFVSRICAVRFLADAEILNTSFVRTWPIPHRIVSWCSISWLTCSPYLLNRSSHADALSSDCKAGVSEVEDFSPSDHNRSKRCKLMAHGYTMVSNGRERQGWSMPTTTGADEIKAEVKRFWSVLCAKSGDELAQFYSHQASVFSSSGERCEPGRVSAIRRKREYCHPGANLQVQLGPIEVLLLE